MKKFALKTVTWYGLLALFVLLGLLPILKGISSHKIQGFQDLDCQGVSCDEGQFCGYSNGKGGQCMDIATRYPNAVPSGDIL